VPLPELLKLYASIAVEFLDVSGRILTLFSLYKCTLIISCVFAFVNFQLLYVGVDEESCHNFPGKERELLPV
jgi:hypothetical protein